MKISKRNLLIYIIGGVLSFTLLGLYFIDKDNPWCIICCSIGASGIGAVILAWLIEDSNNRRMVDEKKKTRACISSPIIRDLTQIICVEALMVEQENEEFKTNICDKTLAEIVEILTSYYTEEISSAPNDTLNDYCAFNEEKQELFDRRIQILDMVGGLFDYAIDDIYSNRSYNISYDLFTDTEITHLKMLQINFEKAKKSESYMEYILNYVEFLEWIDCYDETESFFKDFYSIRKTDEGFVKKDGKLLFIGYRSLINKK